MHEQFTAAYGDDYISDASLNNQTIFRAEIRKHVEARLAEKNRKYNRAIDTLLLDDLASVICKTDVYKEHFSHMFALGFPHGKEHLRLMLQRLVPIRNSLSHANPISLHEAERVLCYSSDIIAALTEYYKDAGLSRDYDTPTFTRVQDSLGHSVVLAEPDASISFDHDQPLRCGDELRIEVKIDSHYPPDSYEVHWHSDCKPADESKGSCLRIRLEPKHVGEKLRFLATLKSTTRDWHRFGTHDAGVMLVYKVLPPV